MWMGEHQGRTVAVKVLKVYSTSDFNKITNVSHHLRFAKSAYRGADDRCDRGRRSARKSLRGRVFAIQMCSRCWE